MSFKIHTENWLGIRSLRRPTLKRLCEHEFFYENKVLFIWYCRHLYLHTLIQNNQLMERCTYEILLFMFMFYCSFAVVFFLFCEAILSCWTSFTLSYFCITLNLHVSNFSFCFKINSNNNDKYTFKIEITVKGTINNRNWFCEFH